MDEENREGLWAKKQTVEVMQWVKGTEPEAEKLVEFHVAPKVEGSRDVVGQVSVDKENGPMAKSFDVNLGWVAETFGP